MSQPSVRTCLVVACPGAVRDTTSNLIRCLGFTVTEAGDETAAMAMCRRQVFTAVFINDTPSLLNGLEVLMSLRKLPRGAHSKVVFVTANDSTRIAAALRHKADTVLLKPFSEDGLQAKFVELFNS